MQFINWLKGETTPKQELSEENKTKVCIITDINKASMLLLNRKVNTFEFDYLYDKDISELENLLFNMQLAIENERLLSAIRG